MATNNYTCAMCGGKFEFEGTMPEVNEDETLVCGECNTRIQALMSMLKGATPTNGTTIQ